MRGSSLIGQHRARISLLGSPVRFCWVPVGFILHFTLAPHQTLVIPRTSVSPSSAFPQVARAQPLALQEEDEFPSAGSSLHFMHKHKVLPAPGSDQAFILHATAWRVPTLSLDFHTRLLIFKRFISLPLQLTLLSLDFTVPLRIWAVSSKVHLANPLSSPQQDPWAIPFPSPGQAPSSCQSLSCASHVLLTPQQKCPLSTSTGLRPSPRAHGQHPSKPAALASFFLLLTTQVSPALLNRVAPGCHHHLVPTPCNSASLFTSRRKTITMRPEQQHEGPLGMFFL